MSRLDLTGTGQGSVVGLYIDPGTAWSVLCLHYWLDEPTFDSWLRQDTLAVVPTQPPISW